MRMPVNLAVRVRNTHDINFRDADRTPMSGVHRDRTIQSRFRGVQGSLVDRDDDCLADLLDHDQIVFARRERMSLLNRADLAVSVVILICQFPVEDQIDSANAHSKVRPALDKKVRFAQNGI